MSTCFVAVIHIGSIVGSDHCPISRLPKEEQSRNLEEISFQEREISTHSNRFIQQTIVERIMNNSMIFLKHP